MRRQKALLDREDRMRRAREANAAEERAKIEAALKATMEKDTADRDAREAALLEEQAAESAAAGDSTLARWRATSAA